MKDSSMSDYDYGYEPRLREIVAKHITDREKMIEALLAFCKEVELSAIESATEAVDEARCDDLCLATNEWSEIVASFIRCDMPDVRSRLMDMGQMLGRDVWIPSR